MKKKLLCLLVCSVITGLNPAYAKVTQRTPEFSNNKTNVWKTVIYPTSHQILAMHRHDYDRVIVALSDGVLKIVSNKGGTHYMTLKKNKAYYFAKDPVDELHTDENMSKHPITVMVIELKQ